MQYWQILREERVLMAGGPLKIAALSVHSCPVGELGSKDTGGMSVYIREVARKLGEQGHSVDIYTRAHDQRDDQIVRLGENARVIHLQVGEVEYIDKLVVYSYLADFACSLENFRKRSGIEYDLIHSHYWLSGWVGSRMQAWWGVPHITMFHTLGAVKNATGVDQDEPELRVVTEREVTENCHRIIAATEKEERELVDYYNASPEAISVIPCGVNLELFRPVGKEVARQRLGFDGAGVVLFVGRLEPLKGVDRLLMAMANVENRQGLRLVVVGGADHGGLEARRLRRLSQELHIQDSVTFVGTVPQEELPFYYSAADVCVIPSYYESFGLVALESLACGTPVVAKRVGGIENVVSHGENGYVVKDNTSARLADGIAAVLSRQGAGTEAGSSNRASVVRFAWPNIAQAIAQEYREVVRSYVSG
ncbi:glycosyltransferase [Chloroflexota bacterium]